MDAPRELVFAFPFVFFRDRVFHLGFEVFDGVFEEVEARGWGFPFQTSTETRHVDDVFGVASQDAVEVEVEVEEADLRRVSRGVRPARVRTACIVCDCVCVCVTYAYRGHQYSDIRTLGVHRGPVVRVGASARRPG